MAKDQKENKEIVKELKCGIIMPITPHPDYPSDHWKDVSNILFETIEDTKFAPSLVSDDPAIGLIHDRIVTNLYNNEIVVCDVSSKNPNVMFELGLRLAFDKPTIIIKDELTGFSFDTGIIEHIPYPSTLRFASIVHFKQELKRRINASYEESQKNQNYSPFLKSFGKTIIPAKITGQEISEMNFVIDSITSLQHEIKLLRNASNYNFETLRIPHHEANSKSYSNLFINELEMLKKNRKNITMNDILDLSNDFGKKYKIKFSNDFLSELYKDSILPM